MMKRRTECNWGTMMIFKELRTTQSTGTPFNKYAYIYIYVKLFFASKYPKYRDKTAIFKYSGNFHDRGDREVENNGVPEYGSPVAICIYAPRGHMYIGPWPIYIYVFIYIYRDYIYKILYRYTYIY